MEAHVGRIAIARVDGGPQEGSWPGMDDWAPGQRLQVCLSSLLFLTGKDLHILEALDRHKT